MALKHKFAMLVSRLGYEVIPHWRIFRAGLTAHLRDLFCRYGIDTVLDVGANEGQYGDFLRNEVGYAGRILSFEPLRTCFEKLDERARKDSRWDVFNVALGSSNGPLNINVSSSSDFSSFLQTDTSQTTAFKSMNRTVRTELVQVTTLDAFLAEERIRQGTTYLKLDTQGYDLEVIRGGRGSIHTLPALQTEASVIPIYSGMPPWRETIDTLEAKGFEISGFFPVSNDSRLRLVEFDAVFVNSSLI